MNRFLIDECLTPDLVAAAKAAGYDATHVTFLGRAGAADWTLLRMALDGDYVLVTNNASDFRALYRRADLHPGLIIIVPQVPRMEQISLFRIALEVIETRSDIINTVIVIAMDGSVSFETWPPV